MNILSVGAVTRYIKALFEQDGTLANVMVRGEISNFKRHYSGHCYFTLKDSDATLRAVMFRGRAQLLRFEPKDGLKVIAGGQISVFERDGQYQLYVDQLIPEGVGELSLAFAQLKDKLAAEGLFEESRKRPLPLLPRTVGIVTSPTGAAVRDIITVAKRRHPGVRLILVPVQVQGPEAPAQIARAIEILNRLRQTEVIVVGRGGGSIEELWAFNDESVVRAIAASELPVVSAVGHQTDYTLADFAADRRAATPSQAAELVVPDVRELDKYVRTLRAMLETHARALVAGRRRRLDLCLASRLFERPERLFAEKRQTIDILIQRLQQALKTIVTTKQHDLKVAAEKLTMLNPLAVLARGYSITRTPEGQVVRRADSVEAGQFLEVVLGLGRLDVQVIWAEEEYDGAKKGPRTGRMF
ncbi:exodeoxyribonuclease VII large subunit [Anaeroselena agilis]|uniref:Exodeoxyribonuclease 7 large subunit n=1 Tax=Anaeroselena agilis TaxID=3063788 RepID=A0ABU3NW93_9FIRM|nr:exodeoxyribonuclease VII large subunit [Selenomonadales bacterium 4137-cl]